ncbi:hypothetical protein T458_14910 [Brevibacillus panacihumi W25]|uniref:Uncharacterized protein n=1 Tax=Brevibacillus panacihumi W25 TaxID=1408254 RepID=V6M312_9BACL|nr:hypothetical protein [Brevibacillus panacihumi]EST52275.1 hypothetical protein T458_14910 [Brevibacillus panacihumi W25]
MKRKEVKRLLREHPEFEAWLSEDASRVQSVRSNPAAADELFKRWSDRKKGRLDFGTISQKTKRASEVLSGVQSIMDMMADYTKKL